MDFSLTEEQKMLKTMVQDFAVKELEPIAAQIDEESRFPAESVKKMAELGLTGIGFPEEYGGSGGGATELCLVTEEISRVCAATGTILLASTGLTGEPIYVYGNGEQRKRFITPIATGEKLAAFALTAFFVGKELDHLFWIASCFFLLPHITIIGCSLRTLYRINRGIES